MSTLEGLFSQREQLRSELAKVEAEIQAAQAGQRNEAIVKVKELMTQFGLTFADLGALGRPRSSAPNAMTGDERPKVAPKFRDPVSGRTWSGRGLKPKWLAAAIAQGKKVKDFAIES